MATTRVATLGTHRVPTHTPTAIARQRGFQLPLLIKMFSNQSCGNKHMDMLNLLLG